MLLLGAGRATTGEQGGIWFDCVYQKYAKISQNTMEVSYCPQDFKTWQPKCLSSEKMGRKNLEIIPAKKGRSKIFAVLVPRAKHEQNRTEHGI